MERARETLETDVLIVGGGPAGLACALHLRRLREQDPPADGAASCALLEKGAALGNHSLSGAVMDPRGMAELMPDYREQGFPVEGEVREDSLHYLTASGAIRFPFTPPMLRNHGNLIISLNKVVRWLGEKVEAAGCDLFPGFAGQELLWEGDRVVGVRTGDRGLDAEGNPRGNYEPGVDIRARITVLAEGVRGSLTKQLLGKLRLDEGRNPQVYATGVKELWELPAEKAKTGRVFHTMGFPLDPRTYGGGWIYDLSGGLISLGFVVGLDYRSPFTDPHRLLQEFKTHPFVREKIEGGTLVRYGAKAIPEGGYFSLPRGYADGVLLAGDAGGYLNAQRLKGVHLALKTGMLAAEAAHSALRQGDVSASALAGYEERIRQSWVHQELYGCRNFRQGFDHGLIPGMIQTGLQLVTGGRGLKGRLSTRPGFTRMLRLDQLGKRGPASEPPAPLADDPDRLIFAKLTSVYHSGTAHEEGQPCHLHVADTEICRTRCAREYGNPCQHFCPASVYEMVADGNGGRKLQINFANCVHCKTCDIMDPYEIITWVPPQGGEGPVYTGL